MVEVICTRNRKYSWTRHFTHCIPRTQTTRHANTSSARLHSPNVKCVSVPPNSFPTELNQTKRPKWKANSVVSNSCCVLHSRVKLFSRIFVRFCRRFSRLSALQLIQHSIRQTWAVWLMIHIEIISAIFVLFHLFSHLLVFDEFNVTLLKFCAESGSLMQSLRQHLHYLDASRDRMNIPITVSDNKIVDIDQSTRPTKCRMINNFAEFIKLPVDSRFRDKPFFSSLILIWKCLCHQCDGVNCD